MGKKNKGPTLRSSDMFTTLVVVCSMDGANICHFPEGALFPFLSGIDYLSPRFVFVENQHVKLSSSPRPARSPEEREGDNRANHVCPLCRPACFSVCLSPSAKYQSGSRRRPRRLPRCVRRVSHTSHPPLPPPPPPPPLSTRLMVVEGHIRIPGDGRKKC